MLLEDKSYEISPLKITRYILKHMAIMFWGVSVVPFYMAWVFATHEFFPTSGEHSLINFILGLIIVGPFLGGSTLLFNDYWDYKMDKMSRRKSEYPLPRGLIRRTTVLKVSIGLMILAISLALIVSLLFMILISFCILLSAIYSAPPIRIKNHAGLDLILNATGAGILCSFAGWIIEKPLLEFPIVWLIPMFSGVAALYIPTTIIDYDSDKNNNVNTIAVRLGLRGAFYFGLTCIIIANTVVMLMGLMNYLVTPEFTYVAWPIAVAQVILYWIILKEQNFDNVFKTVMGLSILLSIGNIILLLFYNGIL
jgi:4-hydroxybenzoate polyprenyltransferase